MDASLHAAAFDLIHPRIQGLLEQMDAGKATEAEDRCLVLFTRDGQLFRQMVSKAASRTSTTDWCDDSYIWRACFHCSNSFYSYILLLIFNFNLNNLISTKNIASIQLVEYPN